MRRNIQLLLLIVLISLVGSADLFAQSHRNCGTVHYKQIQLEKDPSLQLRIENAESIAKEWRKKAKASNTIVSIPVVFHVLWSMNAHNISDAQIYSQMDILNKDFRRLNADTINAPAVFDSLGADIEIEFCLAHQDPDGNWTNGITRTQSTKSAFDIATDEAKFTSQGGHDAWNRDYYLNIWVVPAIVEGGMGGILGYTQPPGGDAATDGVVIGYQYIGNIGTAQAPFNLGRTATHEIGHWFGLEHVWGDDNGACWGDDLVDDTPNQAGYNYGCPNHPHKSCSNDGDMFMNYMDYTDDACMNIFTIGQKARMLSFLNTSRVSLITSNKCQTNAINTINKEFIFMIRPNPANDFINIEWNDELDNKNIEIRILDLTGRIVISRSISNSTNSIKQNISSLNTGVYFVQISNNNSIGTKRLMIQH